MDNDKKSCNNHLFAVYKEYIQIYNPKSKKSNIPPHINTKISINKSKAPRARNSFNLLQVSQRVTRNNYKLLSYNNNIDHNRSKNNNININSSLSHTNNNSSDSSKSCNKFSASRTANTSSRMNVSNKIRELLEKQLQTESPTHLSLPTLNSNKCMNINVSGNNSNQSQSSLSHLKMVNGNLSLINMIYINNSANASLTISFNALLSG